MALRPVLGALICASLAAACVDGEGDELALDDDTSWDDDEPLPEPEPGQTPAPGPLATTVCLNADGPGGQDTYALIERVLGRGAVENRADDDHRPAVRHIREASDGTVGNHFVFTSHRNVDLDDGRTDRSRTEIKVAPSSGAHDALKGRKGNTFTYTWRFRINPSMTFSSRFTHLFQFKSYGGDEGSPLITITGRRSGGGDRLEVIHTGPPSRGRIGDVSMSGLKGVWLEVHIRATFDDRGALDLTIRKPDGTAVISVRQTNLDLWRAGNHIRPKWGIYRGLSDQLRPDEEEVRFANFAITPGASASSTCRN